MGKTLQNFQEFYQIVENVVFSRLVKNARMQGARNHEE